MDRDGARARRVAVHAAIAGVKSLVLSSHVTVAFPPAQIAALLESTCALIESEVTALGDEGAQWHPAPQRRRGPRLP